MLTGGAAFKLQQRDEPPRPGDNLFTPMNEAGAITGEYAHRSTNFSPFTRHLEFYPNRKRLLLAATALGALALLRRRGKSDAPAAARKRVEERSLVARGRVRQSAPPRH
jgi:hypothetical protein